MRHSTTPFGVVFAWRSGHWFSPILGSEAVFALRVPALKISRIFYCKFLRGFKIPRPFERPRPPAGLSIPPLLRAL